MRIEYIIKLAKEAMNGTDNFKEGAVGSNGYGFVFKDYDSHPKVLYIISYGSHKFCGAGAYRDYLKNLQKGIKNTEEFNFSDSFRYDPKIDLLMLGSLKTLVPSLQFGGFENFFDVWVFVITPKGQMFPVNFYWGKSGLSIGAWSKLGSLFIHEKNPLDDYPDLKEFTPFKFNDEEINFFLDAFEFALKKVPVSDFWGISTFDWGHSLMGVKNGRSFTRYWKWGRFERDDEAEKKLEPLLNKKFNEGDETFSIRLLSEGKTYKIYVMELALAYVDNFFGNAKKMLKLYKNFIKD
ncbi:MAG: hypothetical protein ACFFCV_11345 [Promethearchaeota archaeon]